MSLLTARPTLRPLVGAWLVVASLATSACNIEMFTVEGRDSWSKQYTLAPGGLLELKNTNGRIRIEAASDGNTIDVRAEKIARAGNENAARDVARKIEIRESVSADRVALDSSLSGLNITGNKRVDYTVRVPAWARVKLDATNGDIDISGVAGFVEVDATNGRITASGMQHGASVQATNGEVTLDFAKLAEGDVRCDTTNGAMYVTVPRDAKMRVSASVTNGAIETQNLEMAVAEKSRRRLDATNNGGGAAVRLETTNGLISIKGR